MKERVINKIGAIAIESMLFEVSATPKPGLVDRNNCGAHTDMDFYTFMSSTSALHSSFDEMIRLGIEYQSKPITDVLVPLRQIGMKAEKKMFEMTGGVNTHKGMIFTLGILCACAGYSAGKWQISGDGLCQLAAEMCRGICKKEYTGLDVKTTLTKGEKMYLKYGVTGVRGEVESGYKTVKEISLPVYMELRDAGIGINDALVQALLNLISTTNDTNIISRHDMDQSKYAKEAAYQVLKQGGVLGKNGYHLVNELDRDFIERYISPGGCADLLAVTHFLYALGKTIL